MINYYPNIHFSSSFVGNSHISLTPPNEPTKLSYGFKNNKLFFFPDMETVILHLFDQFVFNSIDNCDLDRSVIIEGTFSINFYFCSNQFTTTWENGNPPPEFLEFEREFNRIRDRLLKIKAFW